MSRRSGHDDASSGRDDDDDDELLVNFHDALIYRRDLRILQSPTRWLNSDLIHFHLQFLQHHQHAQGPQQHCSHPQTLDLDKVMLMDPSVTSFLVHQCNDEDEIQEFRTSCHNFDGIRWIYLPINDTMVAGNADWWTSQGSHWSLLRIHLPAAVDHTGTSSGQVGSAEHYNSMVGTNQPAALSVYGKMQRCLVQRGRRFEPRLRTMEKVPQQSNGYDCGLHVLWMIEQLLQHTTTDFYNNDNNNNDDNDNTCSIEDRMTKVFMEHPTVCADLRRRIAQTVEQKMLLLSEVHGQSRKAVATSGSTNGPGTLA
jgi:sentrin-specific protease 8